jgi:uncharacterized protein (TIGR01777 family)
MAKRIGLVGGTGFVGTHLLRALAARGDEPIVVTRNPERARSRLGANVSAIAWDPAESGSSPSFSGFDAIVNLAGETAVGVRYTEKTKARIRSSRIEVTERLVEALLASEPRVKTLVNASGVNYYGAHPPDQALAETAAAGFDFLARVSVDWEAAARKAEVGGVRVVLARLGVVVASSGGALTKMALPFRFFVGGRIGSGEQIMSWIHIEDAVRAIMLCLDDERISGPVNLAAPNAVSNAELAQAIGRALGRPSWLPAPAFALRLLFRREGAEPLLSGLRARPAALERAGFEFRYPEIETALAGLK